MKCFKGFNENMTCIGFQFEQGKTYEENEAQLCKSGFHACEYPLSVFAYYPPANSVYHEVDLEGVCENRDSEKVCGKKITIGERISIQQMVDLSVRHIHSQINETRKQHVMEGDRSAATNTGEYSAATNTGDNSAATNTGDNSAATNTGNWSAATNTGCRSAATNTGYRSAATNTGEYSAATNTGCRSAAKVSGRCGIAIATGSESKACGALGCWIVLAEWDDDSRDIIDMRIARVDGKRIKADTWYQLKGGEFVEVEESL